MRIFGIFEMYILAAVQLTVTDVVDPKFTVPKDGAVHARAGTPEFP